MRVIAGQYRGRVIKMPKGIRPTQDKVRKALFDILGDITGLSFLELFAGSGAVGIEALSRGIGKLVLVEDNRACLVAIKNNVGSLKLKNYEIYPMEATRAIKALQEINKKFDIVFLDPPYYEELAKKTLQILSACDILAPNGFIIAQHFKKDNLPDSVGDLILFKQSSYGDTFLSFYKKT